MTSLSCTLEPEPDCAKRTAQAAEARHQYRLEHGAMSFQMPETKVKVQQPFSPGAIVGVHASAHSDQASQLLVSEMMILAGEAVATLGKALHLLHPPASNLCCQAGKLASGK